jgi:hypothetical protein
MNKKPQKLAVLEARLRRLAHSLGRTGFVSEGSVFERKKKTSGSRYQWTWKDSNQKTVSLTLSPQQFVWLRKAIARSRAAEHTLKKMRQLSQQVLLQYVPGPRRRKRLSIRSLRAI